MHTAIVAFIEALFLATALSTDAFVSSFAYGTNKIRIPLKSTGIISLICSLILGFSLLLGTAIGGILPESLTGILCFLILFILGVVKLFDSAIKTLIQKNNQLAKEFSFSMFSLSSILHIYANPEAADKDDSRILASGEAAALALALSLDSLAVGIGAGMGSSNLFFTLLLTFLCTVAAVLTGSAFGNSLAEKLSANLSWLSGALLIILAFMNL